MAASSAAPASIVAIVERKERVPKIRDFGTLVAPRTGFEPAACRLGGDRSILLSYGTMSSETLYFQGFPKVEEFRSLVYTVNIR